MHASYPFSGPSAPRRFLPGLPEYRASLPEFSHPLPSPAASSGIFFDPKNISTIRTMMMSSVARVPHGFLRMCIIKTYEIPGLIKIPAPGSPLHPCCRRREALCNIRSPRSRATISPCTRECIEEYAVAEMWRWLCAGVRRSVRFPRDTFRLPEVPVAAAGPGFFGIGRRKEDLAIA